MLNTISEKQVWVAFDAPSKLTLMRYISFIIIVFILGCTSINNKQKTIPKKVDVNVDELSTEALIAEDVIDNMYYIPLQTIDTINLIGRIDKVMFIDSSILILDRDISKKVMLFSKNGKFERIIGSYGEGPGQYKKPQDIYCDKASNNIIIYCREMRKLMYFHPNGSFIHEKFIGLDFRSFIKIKDNYLCFTHKIYNETPLNGYLPYEYIVFDTMGTILNTQFENNIKTGISGIVLTHNNYFSKDYDDYYISWTFNDTIYKIHDDLTAEPNFYFDFGKKKLPENLVKQESMKIFKEVLLDGNYHSKYSALVCNDFQKSILVSAGKSDKNESNLYTLIITNDNSKKLLFKQLNYSDNCTYSFPLAGYNDYFVSVLYPDQLFLEIDDQSNFHLNGINTKISEFDNPILVFYKYKLS